MTNFFDPAELAAKLRENKSTVATAESCTGGLIADKLTDTPGSSVYMMGGIVAYNNEIKEKILGVSGETLAKFGAVSEQTAKEMAEGARHRFGSKFGVSSTGLAGPDGDSERDIPVGTVCLAVSSPVGTVVKTYRFDGDRRAVKTQAAETALMMLSAEMKK